LSHFLYIKSGGNWTVGDGFSESEIELLDAQLFAALNGDGGGTWAPSAKIVVGGSGMQITYSGGATPDFPVLGAAHATSRCDPLMPRALVSGGGVDSEWNVQGQGNGSAARVVIMPPHGATLTNVRMAFAVASSHLPAVQLGFRVMRITASTGAQADLNAAGTIITTAGSGAAYFALTSLDYPCTQNNVVDRTLYSYVLLVVDESGAGALPNNLFISARLDFTLAKHEVY